MSRAGDWTAHHQQTALPSQAYTAKSSCVFVVDTEQLQLLEPGIHLHVVINKCPKQFHGRVRIGQSAIHYLSLSRGQEALRAGSSTISSLQDEAVMSAMLAAAQAVHMHIHTRPRLGTHRVHDAAGPLAVLLLPRLAPLLFQPLQHLGLPQQRLQTQQQPRCQTLGNLHEG